MPRLLFFRTLVAVAWIGLGSCLVGSTAPLLAGPVAPVPPNFLLIVGDDCTYNDLPLYGGENARTPNLDALAAGGLTFDKAYLCTAMCQPCRAELYTGRYPMRNGCAWNHSASRKGTRSLPHFLRPLGYRVGLAGKVHVKPAEAFPFDRIEGFDRSCVRDPTQEHDLAPLEAYMGGDGRFCAVVCLVESHIPWVMGDASAYGPPSKLKLPPNLADTPETRKHFADYLAEITYMDWQVGEILGALDRVGKRDETLVLFTSEQGSQFPGCKWTNWNTGVHTALIASRPGVVPAGRRTPALVQYADVAPTLVELAGGDPAEESGAPFDGSSFAAVLQGRSGGHREFVYFMHNNIPEGPGYPVRSISDGTFHYLRNLRPEELYIEKHLMGGGQLNNPYWASWVGAGPENQGAYELVKRYMRRPPEQLYHTGEDPYEMEDLAENPEHAEVLRRLSAALDGWMADQEDPGAALDTLEAHGAAKAGKHLY